MNKLILFDIDGTLLTGGVHDRFTRAIRDVFGIEVNSDRDFRGYTDFLILKTMLEDEGWSDERIESAMPKLMKQIDRVHENSFNANEIKLLPGVKNLLDGLSESDCVLGLITGNLESIAKRKLEAAGIWDYFSVGGFGSDPHVFRADLVSLATKRAGYENNIDDVFVIGDTAKDIEAAHQAGAMNSVGVANGFRDRQELIDAGAKYAFEDFEDTQSVISIFQ